MKRSAQIRIALVVGTLGAMLVARSEPNHPSQAIFDLYQAGKVEQARRAVLAEVGPAATRTANKFTGGNAVLAEEHLSVPAGAANVLAAALKFEVRLADSAPFPDEFVAPIGKVNDRLASAVSSVSSASELDGNNRVKALLAYAQKQRLALLSNALLFYTKTNAKQLAEQIIRSNHDFLTTNGLPVTSLLDTAPPTNSTEDLAVATNKTQVVHGRTLQATSLVSKFYLGLALENEELLDECLYKAPGFANGQQLVVTLQAERQREGDFEKMLMPEFTESSKLVLESLSFDSYRLTIVNVHKRFILAGKEQVQRENDHFTLKESNGKLFVMMKQSGDK